MTTFSKDQLKFFNHVRRGHNILLTGIAGSGKSYCLSSLINFCYNKPERHSLDKDLQKKMKKVKKKRLAVTASTGSSAILINGTTLHSWAGIGLGKENDNDLLKKVQKNRVARNNWRNVDILIIDEISMISASLFDKLEHIARELRECDLPFGGIQIVLTGDFAQLPPVFGKNSSTDAKYSNRKYAFRAYSWEKCVDKVVYLQESFRQGDQKFVNMLNQVREGKLPQSLYELAEKKKLKGDDNDFITKLYSRRDDVEAMNEKKINKLPADEEYLLRAIDSGNPKYLSFLQKYSIFYEELRLRVGTCVMLTRNIDIQGGLVNGAQGLVIDYNQSEQQIYVLFNHTGVMYSVSRVEDTVEIDGVVVATRYQFPIIPCYALTIHKSQGISCPLVEVNLANCFEYGQAYTALSRARSLEGLWISKISPLCVKAAPEVLEFYKKFKKIDDNSEFEFVVDVEPDS